MASAMSLPALAAIVLAPAVFGDPIRYEQVEGLSAGALAFHVLVQFPLQTVIPEEIAFRGALLGLALGVWSERRAQLLVAGAFALSHTVIAAQTVAAAGIVEHPALVALLCTGALVLLVAAGLIFGWLRTWTGSLVAPIAVHWLVVAAIRAGVWAAG